MFNDFSILQSDITKVIVDPADITAFCSFAYAYNTNKKPETRIKLLNFLVKKGIDYDGVINEKKPLNGQELPYAYKMVCANISQISGVYRELDDKLDFDMHTQLIEHYWLIKEEFDDICQTYPAQNDRVFESLVMFYNNDVITNYEFYQWALENEDKVRNYSTLP